MNASSMQVIFCPAKIDHKTRVYGDPFTSDDLHFFRARDSNVQYSVDTRIDDAFRNGFVVKNPADAERVKECTSTLRKWVKWGFEFGYSITVHSGAGDDDYSKLAEAMQDGLSLEFVAWHPFVNGLGGITEIITNQATGLPEQYKINIDGREFLINASRCDHYVHGDYSNSFYGLSCFSAAFDPTLGMRLWEGTALRRQRDYPSTRYLVPLPKECFDPSTTTLKPAIQVQADAAFKDIPYMAVPQSQMEVKPAPIGGPMDTDEEAIVIQNAKESIAEALSVAQSDLRGTASGEKLGTDADDSTYQMTTKDIQQEALPFIKKCLKRLGIEILDFKPASEMPLAQKYEKLAGLYTSYNSAPDELRKPIAELIQDFYAAQFGKTVKIDVPEKSILEEQSIRKDIDMKDKIIKGDSPMPNPRLKNK